MVWRVIWSKGKGAIKGASSFSSWGKKEKGIASRIPDPLGEVLLSQRSLMGRYAFPFGSNSIPLGKSPSGGSIS